MTNLPLMFGYLAIGAVIGNCFASGFRSAHLMACAIATALMMGLHVLGALLTNSGILAFAAVGLMLGVFGIAALFVIAPLVARKGHWAWMILIGIGCATIGLMTLPISNGSNGDWLAVVDLRSSTIKKIWTQPHGIFGLIFYSTPFLTAFIYRFSLSRSGSFKDARG